MATIQSEYIDDKHGDFLTAQLEDLRRKGDFCDVMFMVEEQKFPVHKCVMAASSDYFATMFTGNFKEGKLDTVPLEGVTAAGFQQILTYVYTGKIIFDQTTATALYEAAELFHYENVKTACIEFINKNIDKNTCLEYVLLSERHSLPQIKKTCLKFICNNFDVVSQHAMVKDLPFEILKAIISRDDLCCKDESVVLDVICRWLEGHTHDCTQEQQCQLLEELRFGLVPQQLDIIMEKQHIIGVDNYKRIQKTLYDFLSNIKQQPLKAGKFNRPRGDVCVVVVGGSTQSLSADSATDTMDVIDVNMLLHSSGPDKHKKCKSIDLPRPRTACATVTVGNFLFVLGGKSRKSITENTAHRYDPVNQYWLQLSSMNTKRYFHAAAVVGGDSIIVIGGCGEHDEILRSVEVYSIAEDEWEQKADFPKAMYGLSACTSKGKVYVFSGTQSESSQNTESTLHVYDSKVDTWFLVKKFKYGYHHTSMVENNGILSIIGGEPVEFRPRLDGYLIEGIVWFMTVKSSTFDVQLQGDDATVVSYKSSMPLHISRMAAVCIPGEHIIVLGGGCGKYTNENVSGYKPRYVIQVCDVKQKEWTTSKARLSQALVDCRAEILIFPHNM